MFVRARARSDRPRSFARYDTHDDARRALDVAFAPGRNNGVANVFPTRPHPYERLRATRWRVRAVMRHAWASRDLASAALATATLLRLTRGRRQRRDEYASARAEEIAMEREALYGALEALESDDGERGRGRFGGVNMDAVRIRDRIRTRSAVGSATSEVDAMERATRTALEENDFDSAIAICEKRRRKTPTSAIGIETGSKAFVAPGMSMKKMSALLKHMQWVQRMRTLGFANLADDGYRVLPLIWKPNKRNKYTSTAISGDAEALKYAKEAKLALLDAIRVDEADATLAVALAQLEAFEGNFLQTRDRLMKCLMKNPDDADINAAYAELLINAAHTGYPKESKLSSDTFRVEVFNACKSVLRLDPTAPAMLTMIWKLLDRDRGDFEEEARFVLESVVTAIEVDPANRRVWLMLVTMLTGLETIDYAGDEDIVSKANIFRQPLTASSVQRVFDDERKQWWPEVFFQHSKLHRPGRRGGNDPTDEDIAWYRIYKVVMRILFEERASARYTQVRHQLVLYKIRFGNVYKMNEEHEAILKKTLVERARLYNPNPVLKRSSKKSVALAKKRQQEQHRVVAETTISDSTMKRMRRAFTRKREPLSEKHVDSSNKKLRRSARIRSP